MKLAPYTTGHQCALQTASFLVPSAEERARLYEGGFGDAQIQL